MQNFQEKLELCPYEDTYNEKEFTLMTEIQDDTEPVKIGNRKSMKIKISEESSEESSDEFSEESIEIKSPKKVKIQQIGLIKMSSKKYQLLLTATNLSQK